MVSESTIEENKIKNREASKTYKGYRFQKLRLARVMLHMLIENPELYIIGFPEYWEDLYVIGEGNEKVMEQDKAYSSAFTINTDVVRKSLISFLDIYLEFQMDSTLVFIFHTDTIYGKEKFAGILKDLDIKPLEFGILYYLEKKKLNSDVIDIVSKVISEEYKNIYGEMSKNYKKIRNMTFDDWKEFLVRIRYEFNKPSLSELEDGLISDIKECPYYKSNHIGKEEMIKGLILEAIDKKMAQINALKKAFTSDALENIFHKCLYNEAQSKEFDSVYRVWNEIEKMKDELNDIRNLNEKIDSVTDTFPKRTRSLLNLDATLAKEEIFSLNRKQRDSLKVRIYRSMGEYFDSIYEYKKVYESEELKGIIKDIKKYVLNDLEELNHSFNYGIKNKKVIEHVVMMLIDECFYSFDEEN